MLGGSRGTNLDDASTFDITRNSITTLHSSGFNFHAIGNSCIHTRLGQIAALVTDSNGALKCVTYTRGEGKIKIVENLGYWNTLDEEETKSILPNNSMSMTTTTMNGP